MASVFLSPGVYVQEVPSTVQAIAGVGTSTAGFIGIVGDTVTMPPLAVKGEALTGVDGATKSFKLQNYPVSTDATTFTVHPTDSANVATLTNNDTTKVASLVFPNAPATGTVITVDYTATPSFILPAKVGEVRLCTNFGDFKKAFGDFSGDQKQGYLAHAVYGFFSNGGSRCYVARVADEGSVSGALKTFAGIDEIALVAVPGAVTKNMQNALIQHCAIDTQDRFAILDCPPTVETSKVLDTTLLTASNAGNVLPSNSPYAAFYFPWLREFDPPTLAANPTGDGMIFVPPSGHMAGIYARVDSTRGVHKSPANEVVFGPVGLKYQIGKSLQDGLNPQGVNCIRQINGNIRVWGARTAGGNANGEYKYISVRRLILFLRKSIDQGTQWAVFEPNEPALWSKITRNVSAFLLNVWHDGALFGNTAKDAFFVKCDAETNPPELRDLGQVVTVIGVAPVKPAEFVVFQISQVSGPASGQ